MPGISQEEIKKIADKNMGTFYEYLKLDSVSAQQRRINETAGMVQSIIKEKGGEAEVLTIRNAPPVVYGFFPAGPGGNADKTLLFYNHYDVQPEDPLDEWDTVPFEPTLMEGKLYARGVSDNKANFIARINAVEALTNTEEGLPVNVKFFLEGEEEIGSPHVDLYLEKYKDKFAADVCVWESGGKDREGRLEINAGIKGISYFDLTVESANVDMHSSKAAVVDNAAWRMIQALGSLRNKDNDITIANFYEPMIPPTKVEKEAAAKVPFDTEEIIEAYDLQHPLITEGKDYSPQEALIFYPTLTIGGLYSGYTGPGAKTVLPRKAMAKLEVRLVPGYTSEKVEKLIRNHLDNQGFEDIKMNLVAAVMPFRTDLEDSFVEVVTRSAEKVYGKGKYILQPNSPGTGPMYGFGKYLDVPILGSGTEYFNSGAHAPNEHIRMDDFYQGIEHMIVLLEEYKES